MNDKIKILKKFSVFFVLVFALDFSIGFILRKIYFSQKSGWDFRTTYVINEVKSDVLILGSSRAAHHYNPSIIEDSLKLSTYNGGRDGCTVFYHYALLKSVLKRYHPKVIVLDVMPLEFEQDQNAYDRISALLPYYDSHPEIRPICLLRGKFERFKLLSKMYPYNSKLFSSITTLFNLKRKINESQLKGYLQLNNIYDGSANPTTIYANNIDTAKVTYFKNFINTCRSEHVKVIVSVSPLYIKMRNNSKSIEIARNFCNDTHTPFLDYTKATGFEDRKLFSDYNHMNGTGATKFTEIFISKIRTTLNSNQHSDFLKQYITFRYRTSRKYYPAGRQ